MRNEIKPVRLLISYWRRTGTEHRGILHALISVPIAFMQCIEFFCFPIQFVRLLPQRVCCPRLCAMPVQHARAPEQAREDTSPEKN